MLYALAEAADRKVLPLSESPLLVLLRPYIRTVWRLQQRRENGGDTDPKQGADGKNKARGGGKSCPLSGTTMWIPFDEWVGEDQHGPGEL